MPEPVYFSYVERFFNPDELVASFVYEIGFAHSEPRRFVESVTFPHPFDTVRISSELFERLLDSLHLMLGISYYKLYCPKDIRMPYLLTQEQSEFWSTVYRKGLGEFAYRNNIDLRYIQFPFTQTTPAPAEDVSTQERALVGIGGGKDSVVAVELLRAEEISSEGFVIETYAKHDIAENVCAVANIPLNHIVRRLDPQVFDVLPGSFKGHIPISAVYAFLGYTAALLYDFSYVVTGNEWSSNFGNVDHYGEQINHQWSKSLEFENMFTRYTKNYLSPSVRYFSIVRPLYEIRIAELFARYPQYFSVFTSCNRKFRIDPLGRPGSMWCCECPKCAFVFLMLAPYIEKDQLVSIFGRNLLDDRALLTVFADILGFGSMKPFDCVGTFDEACAALHLVRAIYAESAVVTSFADRITDGEALVQEVRKVAPASSVPQRFRFAGMESVLLLGYAREGKTTEEFLRSKYPQLQIAHADQSEDPQYLEKQHDYDIVVKTAGIPKEKITAHYTTATNIFFSRFKGITVGVTGSKGKSTTASLIHSMLTAENMPSVLVGNIGVPMLSVLESHTSPNQVAVIELSSYQLDDCEFSPHIALVTTLFSDHMDYHGSEKAYHEAKKRIIMFQKTTDYYVYNDEYAALSAWTTETSATSVPYVETLPFSDEAIPLLGMHNKTNVRGAVTVARLLGVSDEAILTAVKSFKSLPHRLELVGEYKGIRFYDDSISTTPESTIAALEAVPNVQALFLGGHDRGYDFTELEQEIIKRGIKNIVIFPESGRRMFAKREGLNILETESMDEAVQFAYAHTPQGGACLLSCASPSYGLYKNFEERGDAFAQSIHTLSTK
ncbi:MAG: putative UDP-N-acetylmuramoylalanine--D-glutamate ligase [Candidatus Kaiserbacteria bacterium]|nr:putative UDP-N-acetylmuramoylalanine--D-glutamate ligase [Candidatus Kaiserbacteria bacterium]